MSREGDRFTIRIIAKVKRTTLIVTKNTGPFSRAWAMMGLTSVAPFETINNVAHTSNKFSNMATIARAFVFCPIINNYVKIYFSLHF